MELLRGREKVTRNHQKEKGGLSLFKEPPSLTCMLVTVAQLVEEKVALVL